jgi:hypothetical protein
MIVTTTKMDSQVANCWPIPWYNSRAY